MIQRLFAFVFLFVLMMQSACTLGRSEASQFFSENVVNGDSEYKDEVQPVFNNRCIACHSCFNSPCQLDLTSFEGVNRGAHRLGVYDFSAISAREPTRLYVDGSSNKDWREKGFFSILHGVQKNKPLLEFMISGLPGVESGLQAKYQSEDDNVCAPTVDGSEMNEFAESNPAGRMPFGLPALEKSEIQTLKKWQDSGAPGPNLQLVEQSISQKKEVRTQISQWESFFNGSDIKSRITARYIYEHLFMANIYFESAPDVFFRLVRSRTAIGVIKEISTAYPFDSAGEAFFYRLRPVTNTLMLKSHIPFVLTNQKLAKWKKDFLKSPWRNKSPKMPIYGAKASNPFETFADLPVKARYQFFLDEAGYHVMTFIKGPVCRGNSALNVINDNFWVFFVSPEKDILVNSEEAYSKVSKNMTLPAEVDDNFVDFLSFRDRYWQAVQSKFGEMQKQKTVLDRSWIWNGDRKNSNATLTVYRHFDSAHVLRGLQGRVPKTVWVLDYHVFEAIYYNLVAGYNVFAPLLHQLNSRLFMEISRVASEDMFLTFFPQTRRKNLRSTWNLEVPEKKESALKKFSHFFTEDVNEKMFEKYSYQGQGVRSRIRPEAGWSENLVKDVTSVFADHFSESQRLGVLAHREHDKYSRKLRGLIDRLRNLSSDSVRHLPDTVLVKVKDEAGTFPLTLVHNKDHYNVAMIRFEDDRRRPEKDSLDVYLGVATSYVNLFIEADLEKLSGFVKKMENAKTADQVSLAMKQFAVLRAQPDFWAVYDWFSGVTQNPLTNERGRLDLNRYSNLRK